MSWQRTADGYRCGDAEITDNSGGAPGYGGAAGSGRWAVSVAGRWVANIDRLADAKRLAEAAGDPPLPGDAPL